MKFLSSGIFWIIVFLLIQVGAFLIITKSGNSISPILGFPTWLIAFIGLEILFSVCFYLFIKFYWSKEAI